MLEQTFISKRFLYRILGSALAVMLVIAGICVWASSQDAVWPELVGDNLQIDGNLIMDVTNAADGYVMAAVMAPTENRMKLRMTYGGGNLTYDLDNTGEYEVFPLQMGSGTYQFDLF